MVAQTADTSGPRLPPLEPPYDPEIARTLERMMGGAEAEPLRLFRTVAHNAHVLDKLRSTGSYLLNFGCVDPLEREIVILRTCARCRSEYEWGVHVAVFARTVGLSDRQIVATTLDEGEAGVWTERQAALIRLADELHERSTVSDALWAELIGWWTPPQLVELVALAGQYHAVSYLTNAFSVQLEDFAARLPSQGAHPTSSSASPSVVR